MPAQCSRLTAMLKASKFHFHSSMQVLIIAGAVLLTCAGLVHHSLFVWDDYRYLQLLQRAYDGSFRHLVDLMIVENRWDDNWWVQDGAFIRYFRPFVGMSFAIDHALFGNNVYGFTLDNVLLHLCATLLVWSCLRKLRGATIGVFLASLCFGIHSCHQENIWYISGRTDTIAAIGFLATLRAYLYEREQTRFPWLTGLCFAFALLAKEYNIFLPFFLFLLDHFVPAQPSGSGAEKRRLYLLLGGIIIFYLLIRQAVVGANGVPPFPYLFLPTRPGFISRTILVIAEYVSGLTLGTLIEPFLINREQLLHDTGLPQLIVSGVIFAAIFYWGWKDRLGRWFIFVFLILLAPLLVLYSSARYLYLPSFCYCGLLVPLFDKLIHNRRYFLLAASIAVLVIVPGVQNVRQISLFTQLSPTAEEQARNLAASPMLAAGKNAAALFLVDFQLDWLANQFLQPTMEVVSGQTIPPLSVLTVNHGAERPAHIQQVDSHTIEIDRRGGFLYNPDHVVDVDERTVTDGMTIRRSQYTVQILESKNGRATRISVRFDKALSQYLFAHVGLVQGVPTLKPIFRADYQPSVPASPLNGPTISDVIQPP